MWKGLLTALKEDVKMSVDACCLEGQEDDLVHVYGRVVVSR